MKAQLSVKREMSIARGPVLGHFGAAIVGLSTSFSDHHFYEVFHHNLASIRAYAAEQGFKEELRRRIDHYSRAARVYRNLNRSDHYGLQVLILTEQSGGLASVFKFSVHCSPLAWLRI
jgi:hypothetical protein